MIGIIAAMPEEMQAVQEKMEQVQEKKIYELSFFLGKIQEKYCVLVQCGVGKVNAGRVTQILIDNFSPNYIINVGSAGAISSDLQYGDVVIGECLIQHDFDITAFGHKKGYITNLGREIKADKELIFRCKQKMEEENKKYQIKIGTIVSGDVFCTDEKMKREIAEEFKADCIEMEGAAIAQVCYLDKVPFLVIRSISDTPDGENAKSHEEFLEFASKRCAEFIEKIV